MRVSPMRKLNKVNNNNQTNINKENIMKLHSIFISLPLLTTGFAAHAMEQATAPVNQKSQLQAHILASDAQQFKDTWQNFQETAQAHEVAAAQAGLTQLATQL